MNQNLDILIVEDSPTQALKLKFILEQQGYLTRVAVNGRAGLSAIEEKRPSLLITDVLMPVMDGYELCSAVKNNPEYRDIPVMILSTLSDPQDIIKGLESGADNFLNKPYSEEGLLSRIEYILVNRDVRTDTREGAGIEIYFANRKHYITSERTQIIDLLLSTYENAVEKNRELEESHRQLRMLHEELEKKNEKLEELNEQKNMLLGMAAHDLRNPLFLIEGYNDYLLDNHGDEFTGEQRGIIQAMKSSSSYMVQLINDLLDVHKIETGMLDLSFRQADPFASARNAVSMNKFSAEKKGIQLILTVHGSLPPLLFDTTRIEQVMSNLIDNAVKYSFPDSTVEIELEQSGDDIRFTIRDHGVGIKPEEMSRLFKPFSRTSSRTTAGEKSTGLGLSISKKIIDQHNGKIWAMSDASDGSVFSFTLPAARKGELMPVI